MKKGFTLIEVLITMAILGIIAGLLMSAISSAGLREQQRNKLLLKKAYTNLSENVANILSDRRNYPTGRLDQNANNPPRTFCEEFLSSINTIGDIGAPPPGALTRTQFFCQNGGNGQIVPAFATGTKVPAAFYNPQTSVTSADKMVWWGLGGTNFPVDIVVDVNGTDWQRNANVAAGRSDKSKNIFGLDVFRLRVQADGRVDIINDPIASPYQNKRGNPVNTTQDLIMDASSFRQ